MAIVPTSTIYNSNGQTFSRSEYQGAIYQEVTFIDRLVFDTQFTITEPINESISNNTVSNYPVMPNQYFMGSFDGFWVHKIFNGGRLVMTVQTVDQDMFIPVAHDRIESVCMQVSTELNGSDCEPPDVPAPGVLAILGIAAILTKNTFRKE
jgi:hypothetical protein